MASTIQIPLPEPLAEIYENASIEDKRKAQWLIELVLRDLWADQSESLIEVIDEISQLAAERGITPEILNEILEDDE